MPRITPAPHRRVPRVAPGFTLIELLVVIAIIALLSGLVIAAAAGAFSTSNERRTALILSTLESAVTEYEAQAGTGFPTPATNYPFPPSSNANSPRYQRSIDDFIEAIQEVPEAAELYAIVSPRFREDNVDANDNSATGMGATNDDNNELADAILDPWGNAVRYVPPLGLGASVGEQNVYRNAGLPVRQTRYFASPGPDGRWGRLNDDNTPRPQSAANDGSDMNGDNIPDAADNLYSFEVE